MRGKTDTRKKILDAASTVVLRDGAPGLTLEQVAKEAGVSKGGLLYHFPSKEALLRGMVERVIADFEGGVLERVAADPAKKGRFLRAYLSEVAASAESGSPQERRIRLQSALIAAVAVDKRLLDPLRERYKIYQEFVEKDGVDAVQATIIRVVADAMWLASLFDMPSLSAEMQTKVLQYLYTMSHGRKKENP